MGEGAVVNWMKINLGKCKTVRSTIAWVKIPLGCSHCGQKIQEASCCKYLGIIIRSDLNWVDQATYIAQKAWKAIHSIMRVLKRRK